MEIRYLFPILFDDYLFTSIWERERERDSTQEHGLFNGYLFRLARQLYSISREKEEIRIFEKNIFFDYRSDDMINDEMDIYNVCFEEQPERKTIASISENH